MGYDDFHLELPLQIEGPSGSQTNAIVDLLAEGPGGFLIVDHKSGMTGDLKAHFTTYRPQLDAYAALVARLYPTKSVHGLVINWMRQGIISVEML